MRTLRLLACHVVAILSVGVASPALALANRVFVSARSGNNANSCDNVNTPCQTFAGAVLQLNPDGEVIVLDSGGYGPVTITQGVTIEAPAGVTAFIHPPSGDAITINAGAFDKVTLRGLTLNVGSNSGITVNSVGTLTVEDCSVSGFTFDGIRIPSGGVNVVVKGTDIKSCSSGVAVRNTSGTVIVTIDRCHLDANSIGFLSISAGGSAKIAITNSTASTNSSEGIDVGFASNRTDIAVIESCVVANNGLHGILADASGAGSETAVSNCTVTGNPGKGLLQAHGVLSSRSNNTVRFNGTDTFGTITPFSGN